MIDTIVSQSGYLLSVIFCICILTKVRQVREDSEGNCQWRHKYSDVTDYNRKPAYISPYGHSKGSVSKYKCIRCNHLLYRRGF